MLQKNGNPILCFLKHTSWAMKKSGSLRTKSCLSQKFMINLLDKKLLTLLALMLLIPFIAFSQFVITGKVIDKKTKEPLPRAHIIVENTYKKTISDNNGNYKITLLKKDTYTIKATYLGYKNFEKQISLRKNTVLNIELERSAILEDEVIISATRAYDESPTTLKNISKKEISQINLGQDIPSLLSSTPSLISTSDAGTGIGYSGIKIRGTDMTRINVTINGIPLNDPESHQVYFVDLPDFASSINNLQIQRGVGTSTNGAAAFGASINIQTLKLKPKPYAVIDNSLGSFNTQKHSISVGTGLINNKFSFDARLSKIQSAGYIDRSNSDLKSFFVSGSYYSKKNLFKFNIFSGKEKTDQAWDGVPSDSLISNRTYNPCGEYTDHNGNTAYYDNQTDNYQQDYFQMLYSRQINLKLNLNAALHYTKGKGYYESYKTNQKLKKYNIENFLADSGITKSDLVRQKWLDNDFYGTTFSANYDNHKKLKMSVGGSWNKYDGDHYGKVIWAKNAIVIDKNNKYYKGKGIKKDFNIYSKINYQVYNKLNLYADMQYRNIIYNINGINDKLNDITQQHNYNFYNPKFGIFYKFNDKHNIYCSYAVANREPNRRNFTDADPGKTPKAETLYDYELGYNFNSQYFIAGANIFYMNYDNQLVLTGEINNVGDPIMVNVPKSYRTGIELTSAAKLSHKLKWNANLTLSKNKINNFTEYIDNWDTWSQDSTYLGETDLSFSPEIIANNQFTFEILKNFYFNFTTKYVGKQYIDNTSSDKRKLNPYLIDNIRINYNFKTNWIKDIGLNLMVNNIFDEKYETNAWIYRYYEGGKENYMDGYFPQAGINFLVGLHLKF